MSDAAERLREQAGICRAAGMLATAGRMNAIAADFDVQLAAATKERDEAREALKGLLGEAWRSCMKAVTTDKCPTSCSNAACRHAQAILARLSVPAPCATCNGNRRWCSHVKCREHYKPGICPHNMEDCGVYEPCPTCGGEGKR